MNTSRPYDLAAIASAAVVAIYLAISAVIIYNGVMVLNFRVLVISSLFLFAASFYIISHILRKYITDRIKLVYKTIHNLKLTRDEKFIKVDMKEDIIHEVNREVMEWAEKRKEELERLQSQEVYRREFLGDVSHELKTPIFNIQGYILTLLDGAMEDPEVNRDYLKKTEKNIERMIHIVEDLEMISQLETGMIKLNLSRFDLAALTREIYELLETKAQSNKISLIFQEGVTKDTQVFVEADKEKIRQVLINLVDNSIKYGVEGGRTKVSFYDMDENILVEISDNGIGIASEHIPRLFERFYRVDKSRSRSIGGSGLGLAIVKHIIESHDQTINVRSAPKVGSTLSFTLKKA